MNKREIDILLKEVIVKDYMVERYQNNSIHFYPNFRSAVMNIHVRDLKYEKLKVKLMREDETLKEYADSIDTEHEVIVSWSKNGKKEYYKYDQIISLLEDIKSSATICPCCGQTLPKK